MAMGVLVAGMCVGMSDDGCDEGDWDGEMSISSIGTWPVSEILRNVLR